MSKEANPSFQDSPGVCMRWMALTTPASSIGFSPDAEFPKVYGVLTDWNIDEITVTIMSMRDGMVSLYTTSTFAVIGGQGHVRVREATARYVKLSEQYLAFSKIVTPFFCPESAQVFYYFMTYNGVRLFVGDEMTIKRGSDPTKPLFEAAEHVLTELRLITEKIDTPPGAKTHRSRHR